MKDSFKGSADRARRGLLAHNKNAPRAYYYGDTFEVGQSVTVRPTNEPGVIECLPGWKEATGSFQEGYDIRMHSGELRKNLHWFIVDSA